MLATQKRGTATGAVPGGAQLKQPNIVSPTNNAVIPIQRNSTITLAWTGEERHRYVIEYDIGRGRRNLQGRIPVDGTQKVFGPLPDEACKPLPYWNPYRFRVTPYGKEQYWSNWITFNISLDRNSHP